MSFKTIIYLGENDPITTCHSIKGSIAVGNSIYIQTKKGSIAGRIAEIGHSLNLSEENNPVEEQHIHVDIE